MFGLLAPDLQRRFAWSEVDYANIVSWFSLAYGIGMVGVGRLFDRIGTKKGFSFSIVAWSVAAMGHALARTVAGFSFVSRAARIGRVGQFSGRDQDRRRVVSEQRARVGGRNLQCREQRGRGDRADRCSVDRAHLGMAVGVHRDGCDRVRLVDLLARDLSRAGEAPEGVARGARAHSRRPDRTAQRISWLRLLRYRQTWAFLLGKALTDPVWLFYLFWLPKFLDAGWGVKLAGVAAPLVAIYVFADTGSVVGGWLSSALIKRGWSVNRSRKTAMLIAALLIVPTLLAPRAGNMWTAVALVSVAAAAHQWWSANLFTSVSDMFPPSAVASVIGIGGFGGAMAGVLFQRLTGVILAATGGKYGIIFADLWPRLSRGVGGLSRAGAQDGRGWRVEGEGLRGKVCVARLRGRRFYVVPSSSPLTPSSSS